MAKQKLIETILEIGILARSIDDLKLNDGDKWNLSRIRKICEDIEVEWKIELAEARVRMARYGLVERE